MTMITLELPEKVVSRVTLRASTRGVTISQQVSELLDESLREMDDEVREAAIRRMNDLFAQTRGFQAEPRIPREELYERGRVR